MRQLLRLRPGTVRLVRAVFLLVALAAVLPALAACGGDAEKRPEGDTSSLAARLAGRPGGLVVEGDTELSAWADAAQASQAAHAATGSPAQIPVDYPLADSVFPPDLTAPTLLWHDDSGADAWLVSATFDDGSTLRVWVPGAPAPEGEIDVEAIGPTNELYQPTPYQASARSWTPAPATWADLKRRTTERPTPLRFQGVRADDPAAVLSEGEVVFSTSKDPVGAPIFYRDVPLMPSVAEASGVIKPLAGNALPLINWRLRDVSLPESRVVLSGMPSCANCHSFSNDGSTFAMDVDGPQGDKGTYAIAPLAKDVKLDTEQLITWNSFEGKPEGHKTIGFLSRISPTGSTPSPPSTRRSTSPTSRTTASCRSSTPPAASSPGTRPRRAR